MWPNSVNSGRDKLEQYLSTIIVFEDKARIAQETVYIIVHNTSTVRVTKQWGVFVQLFLQWKSNKFYISWVCVCSLMYPACNAHAPCHLWPARHYIFPHSPTTDTTFFHTIPRHTLHFPHYPTTYTTFFHTIPRQTLHFPTLFHGIHYIFPYYSTRCTTFFHTIPRHNYIFHTIPRHNYIFPHYPTTYTTFFHTIPRQTLYFST